MDSIAGHTAPSPSDLLSLMRMKGVQRKTQYEQSHTPPLLGHITEKEDENHSVLTSGEPIKPYEPACSLDKS